MPIAFLLPGAVTLCTFVPIAFSLMPEAVILCAPVSLYLPVSVYLCLPTPVCLLPLLCQEWSGDLVYARVSAASRDLEPQLSCVDNLGRATVMGPLK
eukprot:scaffold2541_cov20-Tisochrysis_lutea.AAC.2